MQEINLFKKLPHKPSFPISLRGIVIIYTLFLGLLFIDYINYLWQQHNLDIQHQELTISNQLLSQKVQAMAVREHLDPNSLEKSKQILSNNIETYHQMIRLMTSKMHFSNFLTQLSELNIPGVWLNEINLSIPDKNLSLRGEMLHAELLSKYVEELNKHALIFSNEKYEIREVSKEAGEKKTHHFYLVSHRASYEQ